MRTRRITTLAAGVAALAAVVPAANAATATLTLSPAKGIRDLGERNGVHGYQFLGNVFAQEFVVAVNDDAGAPVTGCLGGEAKVKLLDAKTGALIADAACASTDGMFHLFPSDRFAFPVGVVATVDANTLTTGAAVSAVQSTPAVIVISPEIQNLSPSVVYSGAFPIRGKVNTPRPNKAGTIALELRVRGAWRRQAVRKIPLSGNFEFKVTTLGSYRVHFVPKAKSGYVDSYLTMRVRRVHG